jgi:hypothetical protein
MLDDPRVNFAISTRGDKPGLDHLGFQVDNSEELAEPKDRAESADMALLDEGATTCCYAKSEKHWITDPQGIAWEHFHRLGNIPVFNEAEKPAETGARCAPSSNSTQTECCSPQSAVARAAASGCCSPATPSAAQPACWASQSKSSCC